MQLYASSLLVVQGREEKRQKMLGTVTAALSMGNFFFNLKCEGTGWRQAQAHTHTHTHTHTLGEGEGEGKRGIFLYC